MLTNTMTGIVVDCSLKIHNAVGPGCFERVYEESLYYELNSRGLHVIRQKLMPIVYKELNIPDAYKLDLLVEKKVILEIKCAYELHPGTLQTINYLFETDEFETWLNFKFQNRSDEGRNSSSI